MAAQAYSQPRVRVAAVILLQGELVLARHRFGAHTYHLLPGGGVKPGETLEAALLREVEEETGLRVRLLAPLFLSDTLDPSGARHIVNITFLAEPVGGELTHRPRDPRVEAVDLVDPDALVTLDLRPPIASQLAQAVRDAFSGPARYLGSLWVDEPLHEGDPHEDV